MRTKHAFSQMPTEAIRYCLANSQIKITDIDVLALDEALSRLAGFDPRKSAVAELRFFSGLSVAESAHVLGVSVATVERDWQAARAWLFAALK